MANVFDEPDRKFGMSIVRDVEKLIDKRLEVQVTNMLGEYVITFRGDFSQLSWRNHVAMIVEEIKFLKDIMVVFATSDTIRKLFKVPQERSVSDELLIRLCVMKNSARTVGSRPPVHDFAYEKESCFGELAKIKFKDTKTKPPPSWVCDLPVLETFTQVMYNDCANISVEQFMVPSDDSKPYEISYEGIIEDFSQSLLEVAIFGNDEVVKDVVCEIGLSEESRRVTAFLCGGKVNPLPQRNPYRL